MFDFLSNEQALTQSGSLFFIASNSSAMGISNMAVVFVNDGMITSKGASSPVQSVLRGTWTLEAMASSEYRSIGPFYYEQYLKDRYANGADGRKCFDILRDSVIYDFGRAMQISAIGAEDYWRPCFWVGGNLMYSNSFAELYRSSSGERTQNLQKLLEDFAKYKDN